MLLVRMLRQIVSRLITPNDCDRSETRRTCSSKCVADIHICIYLHADLCSDDCRGFNAELTLPHNRPDVQSNNTSYIPSILISSYRYLHRSSATEQSSNVESISISPSLHQFSCVLLSFLF